MTEPISPYDAEAGLVSLLGRGYTISELEERGLVESDSYGPKTPVLGLGWTRGIFEEVPGVMRDGRKVYSLISVRQGYRFIEGPEDVRDRRPDDNWER